MKTRTAVALVLSSLFLPSLAFAEEVGGAVAVGAPAASSGTFGRQGTMVLTLDRLVTVIGSTSRKYEAEANAQGLVLRVDGDDSRTISDALFKTPTAGFHYFVAPNLSVGVGLGYNSWSGSSTLKSGGQSTTTDDPSITTLIVAPRVGYVLGISSVVSFWLKGGVTYGQWKATSEQPAQGMNPSSETTLSITHTSLTLDPMFTFSPTNGVAFMAGPILEFPLSGSAKSETKSGGQTTTFDGTLKFTHFGAAAGAAFYF